MPRTSCWRLMKVLTNQRRCYICVYIDGLNHRLLWNVVVILKVSNTLQIKFMRNSGEAALRPMPENNYDDKSTLVQVMAWCLMASSHYLSQCWPSSMLPYDATRPWWVNSKDVNFSPLAVELHLFSIKPWICNHFTHGWMLLRYWQKNGPQRVTACQFLQFPC